jgi:secreted Zn-dependent insulinase-like peptidase
MRTLDLLTTKSINNEPKSGYTSAHLDTPKLKALLATLTTHHHTHYSANLMKAVILGPQSLTDLQQIASKTLTLIPNRSLPLLRYKEPLFRGPIAVYRQTIKFIPKNPWCFTSICYYIPSILFKKHKPGKFFIHLLTSNEKHSFKWT